MIKEIDNEAISHVYHTFDGNTYYNQKTIREAFASTAAGTTCAKATTE